MFRYRGSMIARDADQLTPPQQVEGCLDSAFRKPGRFRERAQARANWFPSPARGLPVEMKVNEIGGRLAVVTDDILHQDIKNVIVNWNGLTEARHLRWRGRLLGVGLVNSLTAIPINGQGFSGTSAGLLAAGGQRLFVAALFFFVGPASPIQRFIAWSMLQSATTKRFCSLGGSARCRRTRERGLESLASRGVDW
jgi:hypothetical protein